MKIGQRSIENFGIPYIIAEIGANHNGNLDLAKKMVKIAKEMGADCAKFQSWSKNSVFSKVVYDENFFLDDDYRNRKDFNLEAIVEKYSLNDADLVELNKFCVENGIDFASTPFSKKEVDFLVDELDVKFIKIASMDLDNLPFLEYVAKKNKPIILSTGLNHLSDIDEAVRTIYATGNNQLILMHCISVYPPKDQDINLNFIETLQKLYDIPVGFSDHSIGATAPILSIAKGACVIEKHFTLDKNMEGWDHAISANPEELKIISHESKRAALMLGSYSKKRVETERRRNAFKRSIVAARDIPKDSIIQEEDLDYKRPGTGIPPKYSKFIIGKVAKREILFDELIKIDDF